MAQAAAWFLAFLDSASQLIERRYSLDAFRAPHEAITLTVDASPWGMGAVLSVNSVVVEFWGVRADPL